MNDKAEVPPKAVKAPLRKTKAHKPRRGIRELPSGRFQVRYTDPYGQVKSGGTFLRHDDAVERLDRILRSIDIGTYEQAKAIEEGGLDPKAITLIQLAEHWRAIRVNKRGEPLAAKTLKEYTRYVQNTLAPFRDKPIRSISASQVEKWWASEYRRAPREINAAYKHMSSLMKWAVKRKLINSNPCDIEGATSYISDETPKPTTQQVEIMLQEAPEGYKALIALAAWGGIRKGELLALRRSDIEIVNDDAGKDFLIHISKSITWANRIPEVKSTKNNETRVVVMPPFTQDIISRHLNSLAISPDALLFPLKPGGSELCNEHSIRPMWQRLRAQAGYSGPFHSLRTFGSSEYSKTDANYVELQRRFGHKDLKTAMRYQRTTGRERELARQLG